jgi:hypothetical protein
MIKGRLGLKWRGTILVGIGIAAPLSYVVLSGGPTANNAKVADAPVEKPTAPAPPAPPPEDEFARPKPRVQPPAPN